MKTSRLSLATAVALGLTTASLSAANTDLVDIRLQNSVWKFIGVASGFVETASSSDIIDTSIYTDTGTESIDDNVSTDVNTEVSFRVIDHSANTEFSSAKMYVNGSGHTLDGTAFTPSMYVYVDDGNTTPDIRITYQSDYEGETFYLELNGSSNVYSGTFESTASYSSPQALVTESSSSSSGDENLTIEYIFDTNLENNPGYPGVAGGKNDYTYSDYHDNNNSGHVLKIFHYNAIDSAWEIFATGNSNDDFTELEAGKGYWVKVTDANNTAGLILGSGTISSSDYNVTEGWNMVAMNDAQLASTGATGLLVEFNVSGMAANPTAFTLEDSEGTVSIDLNSSPYYFAGGTADANLSKMVQIWNKQIATKQREGNISENFNIRIYDLNSTNDANTTFIVSDKKFRIKEFGTGTDYIKWVRTAGGNAPYDLGSNIISTTTDLDDTGVASVYGEAVLALKRVSGGTADAATYRQISMSSSSTIEFAVSDATAETNFETDGNITNAFTIDTDFDGVTETIVLVDDNDTDPFYVRDRQFTKKYDLVVDNINSANGATLYLNDNNGTKTSVDINTPSSTQLAAKLTTGNYKAYHADTNGSIYIISQKIEDKGFSVDQQSGTPILTLDTDADDDNVSGIAKEVYSMANLATAEIDTNNRYRFRLNMLSFGDSGYVTNSNDQHYVEFNISNDVALAGVNRVTTPAYARIRFGGFHEVNSTLRSSQYGDYNFSVSGSLVTLDYTTPTGASSLDLNISMTQSDLNGTGGSNLAKYASQAINYYFTDVNSTFDITASYTGNDLLVYGDFNLTIDDNGTAGDTNLTISDSNVSALVYESNLTITPLVDDLKYNKVYAGTLSNDLDNPISTIQRFEDDNGDNYKVTKILTTNEFGSSFSWNFIDLTKSSDNWFDEEDSYNLFSFDSEKGYWVYLEGGNSNPVGGISSSDLTLSVEYLHKFVGDTNDTDSAYNMTTTNVLSDGTVTVDISDMTDSTEIDRVIASVGGYDVTMSKSGNEYVGTFSEYELGAFSGDTIDVNVTFFTDDSFSKTVSNAIDNVAPEAPTLTINNAYLTDVDIATTSTDVTRFYLYSGDINDSAPGFSSAGSTNTLEDDNISTDSSENDGYNFCASVAEFNDNIAEYRVIAVDEDDNSNSSGGDYSYNRASDAGYLEDFNETYYAIYKNASILGVTSGSTDSISVDFNSTCGVSASQPSTDYGVAITALSGYDFNVSFETNSTAATLSETSPALLRQVDLSVDGTTIGSVQFNGGYYNEHNQIFILGYSGLVYSTNFAILDSNDSGSIYFDSDNNVTQLTGQAVRYQ
jgi:hypothetical protein